MNEKDLVVDRDAQLIWVCKRVTSMFRSAIREVQKACGKLRLSFHRPEGHSRGAGQDILVKCYLGADTYQPNSKLSTWIFRIARNHCLNEVRRQDYRYRSVPLPEYGDEQPASMNSPEEEVEAAELKRTVGAVLAALPEKQRMALLLSRQQSMSYEEIAQALGPRSAR